MKSNEIAIDYWRDNKNNFGDCLNSYIVEKLSGKKIVMPKEDMTNYSCVGSILQKKFHHSIEIWGSGAMYKDRKVCNNITKIHAIRGKLSRDIVLHQGIDCPEIYGDPGILLPLLYQPKTKDKKFSMGVISHYVDHDSEWVIYHRPCNSDIHLINILDDIEKVIDEINQCICIISSSLHGLIVADVYGIPSLWVEFSDQVRGEGFKFFDYMSGMDQEPYLPFQLRNKDTTIYQIEKNIKRNREITKEQQRKLLEACPFNNLKIKV